MGLFITFEGPEGSGKSTQARRLYERIASAGYPVMRAREPGGTRIGEHVREIVLNLQHAEMDPTTEVLLFSAARAQLVAERIMPYLRLGGIVICDRFADATYAYQGFGLGRDLSELRAITAIATAGLQPDITLLLDVPVELGLARKRPVSVPTAQAAEGHGAIEWNRLDARETVFHERVRQGYLSLAADEPGRWVVLDGTATEDALETIIWQHVQRQVLNVQPLEHV